ncbi:uncharacterized protein A1O9_01718 [Exophiala aquamarina CBS 119918]|uniref:Alpha/beta hydrolase fold-3 domain-containing protein n=1 Tax=Exophiala aquamarina CBS 119918 TaxID=1182545 RepID=A0A072Q733_9EURO|nr:uncharacterized protein A1O9_01718 [Exophiala aquamarina CBS 119918]KEF63740.1 hypothetical protein A1O9_01718 [Exophiala aquamarina CBS 119918]
MEQKDMSSSDSTTTTTTTTTTTGEDATKSVRQNHTQPNQLSSAAQAAFPERQSQSQSEQQAPKLTADGTTASSSSSIEINTRSDISLLYRVVRTLIRPLRPNLVRPGKPLPPGSPRLSASKNRNGVAIVESCFEGVWQYTFRPKSTCLSASASTLASASSPTVSNRTSQTDPSPSSSSLSPCPNENGNPTSSNRGCSKHRIYYFNGGGFQSPPSSQHWLFLSMLSKNLSQQRTAAASSSSTTTSPSSSLSDAHQPQPKHQGDNTLIPEMTLVSYPLAPNSPAEKSYPIMQKWLSAVLHSADTTHDKVTLMGDSSGGNIALSLGFWAVENHHQAPQRSSSSPTSISTNPSFPLTSILAISPVVDLRNVNPSMASADKFDPVLTIPLTSRVARAWASPPTTSRHLSEVADGPHPHPALVTNAQVSPLLNSDAAFQALASNRVRVHGIVGTHDVLAPDALLFMRKCERCGVAGRWLVWERQMHCFPLAAGKGVLGLWEARDAVDWIVGVLRAHEF